MLISKCFNSIDGATALKLDESFEIKNNEEKNSLINNLSVMKKTRLLREQKQHHQNKY